MNNELDVEQVRQTFAKDRFATEATGCVIDEVGENSAVCSFEIQNHHKNAAGGVMGGAIFALADFAFAVATNHDGNLTMTVSSSIEFISGAKGKRLIATAKPNKVGRSLCFYTIDVCDDTGRLCARVSATGMRIDGAKVG